MSAQVAVNILWAVWYATWIGAVFWSARTQTQMKTDMGGLHRFLSGAGVVLLFLPTARRDGFHTPYDLFTGRLWRSWSGMDWSLFALAVAAFAFCWWARLHLDGCGLAL